MKIKSLTELYDLLPENEMIIVDVLRSLIKDTLPDHCREKISYNVPFFYGKKGICIIWPSTIPRGGIKEGVLLGFWYGNRLSDEDHYLLHGTNKQIFYKICCIIFYYWQKENIGNKILPKLNAVLTLNISCFLKSC